MAFQWKKSQDENVLEAVIGVIMNVPNDIETKNVRVDIKSVLNGTGMRNGTETMNVQIDIKNVRNGTEAMNVQNATEMRSVPIDIENVTIVSLIDTEETDVHVIDMIHVIDPEEMKIDRGTKCPTKIFMDVLKVFLNLFRKIQS